jgi:ribosomal protein S18 acetylase RimI-like enzyme
VITTAEDILALERISARAWPPARAGAIGDWALNATNGFSGRVNACWPLGDPGLPLPDAIAAVEAWYAHENLPCRFKIVAPAAPAGLVARLEVSGYQPRTETVMMIGPAGGPGDLHVRIADQVDAPFAAVFAASADGPGDAEERLGTLGRVPAPRALARLDRGGVPAAIGAAAAEGGWVGLFAMRTDPAHRRQGLARRVLGALLAWAEGVGARRAWLQVEADNDPAIALYRARGFEEAYRYRYWFRPQRG